MTTLISNDTQVRVSGTEVSFTDEPLITTDNVIYKIQDKDKSVWRKNDLLTVNTVDIDDKYEVDWANGSIRFEKCKNRGDLTVSGEYLNTTVIGKILSYSLENTRDFMEFHFVGAIDKENIPLSLTVSGNIESLEINDPYFLDAFKNAEKLLIEFAFGDIVKNLWVYIEKHTTNHTGGDLVKNNISFKSTSN